MTIKTSLELVRYIRHHIAGSEWQDVKAVEDFVEMRINQWLSQHPVDVEVDQERKETERNDV